jgi:hypothetical protein
MKARRRFPKPAVVRSGRKGRRFGGGARVAQGLGLRESVGGWRMRRSASPAGEMAYTHPIDRGPSEVPRG